MDTQARTPHRKKAKERHLAQTSVQATREALVNAAQNLFARQGFKATSVHDIAKEAGVNVSLVNYHFHGKEGLFRACVDRVGTERLSVAERILSSKPKSLEELKLRLGMYIGEMLLYYAENPEVTAILTRDLLAEFEILEDILQKTFIRSFEFLTEFLVAAKSTGLLAEWVKPTYSASLIFGELCHIARSDFIGSKYFNMSITDPAVRAERQEYILRSFLHGAAKPSK